MKLDAQTTPEHFRKEMQHRVVKYRLNSRPVKEAVRFAKQHDDAAFYRIASDKIHAQRQFQRELNGPGKLERFVDFLTLGSLREVIVTLVLVVVGVIGLELAQRSLRAQPEVDGYEQYDFDRSAARIRIPADIKPAGNIEIAPDVEEALRGLDKEHRIGGAAPPTRPLSDADVARIADAVIQRLTSQNITPPPSVPADNSAPATTDDQDETTIEKPAASSAEDPDRDDNANRSSRVD